MKKIQFMAVAMAAVALLACNPDDKKNQVEPPIKSTVPEVEATDGAYTIVWNAVDYSECNGLVFVGNYNGWSTDASQLTAFEKIDGYTNWYKAVVVPTTDIAQLEGKPCALASDGTFPANWDHQWIGSEEHPCELLKGPGEFTVEYETETKMIVAEAGAVTYVKSYGFKVDPCIDEPVYDIVFNVTLAQALDATHDVYVVGDFVENAWTPAAYKMTRVDDTHFTATVAAKIGREYKYVADATVKVEGTFKDANGNDSIGYYNEDGWYFEMAVATPEEGKDCSEKGGNKTTSDITVNDEIYGFFHLNAEMCAAEVVPGEMYIKCAGNSWTATLMTMVDDNTYTYETTITDASNIGANVGPSTDALEWYPLTDATIAAGDEVIYTFTVEPAALTIAKK